MPDTESLLSTSEVLKILDIPSYRLDYLFKARKLRAEDFTTLKGSNHRVYRYGDLAKIKEALFGITARG